MRSSTARARRFGQAPLLERQHDVADPDGQVDCPREQRGAQHDGAGRQPAIDVDEGVRVRSSDARRGRGRHRHLHPLAQPDTRLPGAGLAHRPYEDEREKVGARQHDEPRRDREPVVVDPADGAAKDQARDRVDHVVGTPDHRGGQVARARVVDGNQTHRADDDEGDPHDDLDRPRDRLADGRDERRRHHSGAERNRELEKERHFHAKRTRPRGRVLAARDTIVSQAVGLTTCSHSLPSALSGWRGR